MKLIKKIFNITQKKKIEERIRITEENLPSWPKFKKLFEEGKVKFDSKGRLRYLHGAPVGDLILTRINKDGKPIYKESAEEWFDPDTSKANGFIWP